MRLVWRALVIIGILAVLATATAAMTPAAQGSCGGAVRCYARAVFIPSGNYTGGLASINASRLTFSGGGTFSTTEMWVCDPQLFAGSDCNTWVEAGHTIGTRSVGSDTSLTGFWAEQDGGGCNNALYVEHYPSSISSVTLGASYNYKISFNGSFRFAVYRNGSFVDNSAACHDTPMSAMMTGLESNATGNQITATSSNLQKRNSDNTTWSYNWGGSVRENIPAGGPEHSSWITPDASIQYGQN